MLDFIRRNQVLLTSGCLLLFALVLISNSASEPRLRDPVSALVVEAMRPLQQVVTQSGRGVAHIWHRYIALVGIRSENQALRRRILELERDAVRQAEIEQTNRRLQKLLEFRASLPRTVRAARVTGKDPLPWFRSFVIDKGRADGVRKGMAVLSPYGLVGQILEASQHAARVLLITDHNSGVDALVQRSRARGIVEGAVAEGCVMKYLQRGEDVRPGDRVVTSGFDGIFPKGIVIGRVTGLTERSGGLMRVAEVEPAVPFDRLEEVLVFDSRVGRAEESP